MDEHPSNDSAISIGLTPALSHTNKLDFSNSPSPRPSLDRQTDTARQVGRALNPAEDLRGTQRHGPSNELEPHAGNRLAWHSPGNIDVRPLAEGKTPESNAVPLFSSGLDRHADIWHGTNTTECDANSPLGARSATRCVGKNTGDEVTSSTQDGWPASKQLLPLTSPNGLSMFSSLSTSEQDDFTGEAGVRTQRAIVADSDGNGGNPGNLPGEGCDIDCAGSSTTSLGSSVRDYLYENGRRYHRYREGLYNFPNDAAEQEREDMQHAMVMSLCCQNLHFAPIGSRPQHILDIGTGTGIWAVEMAEEYPSAQVLGIDLSPIQPEWIPPNLQFVIDDAESPWLHPAHHFDYIHSRHMVVAVKDWAGLLQRSFEHLKPGGWMELQEMHYRPAVAGSRRSLSPQHPVVQYWSLINAGLCNLGVDFLAAGDGRIAEMMQAAGFVNITERTLRVPIGPWPRNKLLKSVGMYWRAILMEGLQAIALGPLTRGLGWSAQDVEMFLMKVRTAYRDDSRLMYMRFHIICGQKPPLVH